MKPHLSEAQADVLDSIDRGRRTLAALLEDIGRLRNTVRGALQQLRRHGFVACWRPKKGHTYASRWTLTCKGRSYLRPHGLKRAA